MELGVVRRHLVPTRRRERRGSGGRRCRRRAPRRDHEVLGSHGERPEDEHLAAPRIDDRKGALGTGGEGGERRDAGDRELEREGEPARDREPDPRAREAARPGPDDDRREIGGDAAARPRGARRRRRAAPAAASLARRGSRRRPRARSSRGQLRCRTPGSARARSSSSVPSAPSTVIRRSSGATCSSKSETRARRQGREARVGPLDERDRAVEVGLEIAPLGGAEPDEAVEIEVRDRRRAPVEVADRERGARHRAPRRRATGRRPGRASSCPRRARRGRRRRRRAGAAPASSPPKASVSAADA